MDVKKVPEWLEIYMEDKEYDELYYKEDDPTLELYRDDEDDLYYDSYDEDWYPKPIGEVDDYDALMI